MDDMTKTDLIELTAEIISAYVSNNTVVASDLPAIIGDVHDALSKASQRVGQIEREELRPAGGGELTDLAAALREVAAELREKNINVNCVLPTVIDTPENRAAMPEADPRRWVAPQDLAAVIVFLASDAARAVHGAALPVTGLS